MTKPLQMPGWTQVEGQSGLYVKEKHAADSPASARKAPQAGQEKRRPIDLGTVLSQFGAKLAEIERDAVARKRTRLRFVVTKR